MLAAALPGCGEVSGLPSADPVPVLQGVVVSGETRHFLRVEWSSPTDVPYTFEARPIDESLVDLWLVPPSGDSIQYTATQLAGEFAVTAPVSPAQTYSLAGTVAGRRVTAETTVPGAVEVALPAGDTLRISGDFWEVQYAWHASSAGSYQPLLLNLDGTANPRYSALTRDSIGNYRDIGPATTGRLLIQGPFRFGSDTARLLILAYDRTATAFFSSSTRGNVHGGFGLFGAAAKAEKVVVWQ
jgi:hypothetical protein